MTTQNLALLKALGAKMDYVSQRQRVISQNIANADTPNYRPQDLTPVDFSAVLKGVSASPGRMSVQMKATNARHVNPSGDIGDAKAKKQKETYEVAPAGNAVIMEEQLMTAGQNMMDYNLMTNLYQKHVGMIKIALGAGR